MSERFQGSQLSNDVREVKDLTTPRPRPVPPTFSSLEEWEGFQSAVCRAFDQGLLPESIKTRESAIVIASKGREMGFEPLYALSVIYLVKGKPAIEGEAMLGLVLKRYPETHVAWIENTHEKATLELGRQGSTKFSRFTFTVQDALRAGLITKINADGTVVASPGKTVWSQYTRKMLCWRAVSEGVTLLFPECIQGVLTPEELQPIALPVTERVVSARDIDDLILAGTAKAVAQA